MELTQSKEKQMKKGMLLMLLFVLFPALVFAGARVKNLTEVRIDSPRLLDATTLSASWGISSTTTTCYAGTATGCSITCMIVPASTSAAFVTNFRIPNDYANSGKFYICAKPVAADTTAQFRLDIQAQELNSLTKTTVTNGTNSTAFAAGNDSQWREIYLANGATYSANSLLNLYVSRIAGTGAVANVAGLVFWYHPLAIIK